ncbi:MAG: hypothetical protein AAF449_08300 [Myxococcota bacterium]
MNLKHGIWALGFVVAFGAASACSSDDDDPTPMNNNGGGMTNNNGGGQTSACDSGAAFDAPSATICPNFAAVNFRIDDSTNNFFQATDFLAWKGGFGWDPSTETMNANSEWSEPFPLVFDDGPWNEGGHEPAGATAGDGIWGIAAFFDLTTLPAEGSKEIGYGAIRGSDENGADGQWIWNRYQASNGSFTVSTDDSGLEIEAGDMIMPTFGDIDVRFTIDAAAIQALDLDEDGNVNFPNWDPTNGLRVKSSWWDWIETPLTPNADNSTFTVTLEAIANDNTLKTGLLSPNSVLQFVLVLAETGGGVEYKADNEARTEGVTVEVRVGDGEWMPATVNVLQGDLGGNTAITAPAP